MKSIYILYEHKEWDQGLVATLEQHGFKCEMWPLFNMNTPLVEPRIPPGSLIINRFSPSFATRTNGNTLGAARSLVRLLESHGHHVINGGQAVELEVSKGADHRVSPGGAAVPVHGDGWARRGRTPAALAAAARRTRRWW